MSIHRPLRPGEEGGHPASQGVCFRGIGSAAGVDPLHGGLLGLLQKPDVEAQVRYPESGQA